jgi:uncharacterized protein (TIGR00730 family)
MRSVCVFCGSNPGRRPEYLAGAADLGRTLAARGIRVVYGGAHVGLMGALADAVLAAGGEIIGVIPGLLVDAEVAHPGLSELRVTGSMHERKAVMAELADGFIALPGGIGTLEELAEIVTWAQLGLHAKPAGLLNVLGYYEGLLGFLDHAMEERFVRLDHREMILARPTAAELLAVMDGWTAPPRTPAKWIDADGSDIVPGRRDPGAPRGAEAGLGARSELRYQGSAPRHQRAAWPSPGRMWRAGNPDLARAGPGRRRLPDDGPRFPEREHRCTGSRQARIRAVDGRWSG